MPTLHCDYDGLCDEWALDYYEMTASSVGDVKVTKTERAPGWLSTDNSDWCPKHQGDDENV